MLASCVISFAFNSATLSSTYSARTRVSSLSGRLLLTPSMHCLAGGTQQLAAPANAQLGARLRGRARAETMAALRLAPALALLALLVMHASAARIDPSVEVRQALKQLALPDP